MAAALILLLALLAAAPLFQKGDPEGGSPSFFQASNLRDIAVTKSYVLVAAVGMTLVILCRQIDISIGSQLPICAYLGSLLAGAGLPVPLAFAVVILAGAALGAVNGFLVACCNLPSIVVTLATMVTFRHTLGWLTDGTTIHNVPGFQWMGLGQSAGQWVIVLSAVGVFLAFAWALRSLAAGRAVYLVGSDAEAARLAGIRPRRVVFGVFVLMGALTGAASLLNAVQFSLADPAVGQWLELQVIAAVVVGGTAVSGGRGTLWGTFVGVLLLSGVVGKGLVFLRVEAAWEQAIQGAIILVAVASDALNLRQKKDAGVGLVPH